MLEVILTDPENVKHELKTMDKCRDSASIQTDRSFLNHDELEVVCKFDIPKKGKWQFSIVNPMIQAYTFKLNVFVYFKMNEDNYYPNYYNNYNNHFRGFLHNKRLKKRGEGLDGKKLEKSAIKIDARWAEKDLDYQQQRHQVIFASFSKDLNPILNASVKAVIYRPSGDSISLELHDNGLNADRSANDGIYSRYFSNFNINGNYFARVNKSFCFNAFFQY